MNEFISKHQKDIQGTLSGFDRVRFRGTFRVLAVAKLLMVWLRHQKVLVKDFGDFATSLTQRLKQAVEQVAKQRVRDIEFLRSSKYSKEDLVAELIRREGLTEGVVCVLSAVEMCRSYEVRRNPDTKTLDLEPQPRKCLHWYVHFWDAVLGLCHVRIPSWLPFTVHVCVNGREWLCRELTKQGNTKRLIRPEGVCLKHRLNRNTLKMYDKQGSVLRVETTINDTSDFGVHRASEKDPHGPKKWRKLRKGVADLPRRAAISQSANTRYLTAIAAVDRQTPLGQVADQLAKPVVKKKSRSRGLTPLTGIDSQVIAILLRGEFALNGFRNRDLRDLLFPTLPATASNSTASNSTATPNADEAALPQRRRQSGQVTRLLRLFRAHRLIQKIPRTHRYQLTANGRRILPTFSAARAASTQAHSQIAA